MNATSSSPDQLKLDQQKIAQQLITEQKKILEQTRKNAQMMAEQARKQAQQQVDQNLKEIEKMQRELAEQNAAYTQAASASAQPKE